MSTPAWKQACLNIIDFKFYLDVPKDIFIYIEMQYILTAVNYTQKLPVQTIND